MFSLRPRRGHLFGLATGILLAFPLFSTRAVASPGYAYGTIHNFGDGSVPVDGEPDINSLIQGPGGNLYGVTVADTAGRNGVIIKVAPDGSGYTILHHFSDGSVANDGQQPYGKLVVGPDGNLWGTTSFGGIQNGGSVFKIAPDGSGYTVMHRFGDGSVPNDGNEPNDGLIVGSDGNFYGTTNIGGDDSVSLGTNGGTIFKITPTGVTTIVHSFPANVGPTSGNYPTVGVIQGPDGTLYGMTNNGGTGFEGGIFKINPDGSGYTVLHNFDPFNDPNEGAQTYSRLLLSSDGKLYGTVAGFGLYNDGVLFRLNTDGSDYKILHEFGDNSDETQGGFPYCALIAGPDGNFYGTTSAHGVYDNGTIYQLTPSGTYSTVYAFDGTQGIIPEGDLLLASDGNFYGMTVEGGAAGVGTIFRFSLIANLNVSAPASVTAGVPFNATVTARNYSNNAVTDYSGTVHFTSDDPTATLPADTIITGGVGNVQVSATRATAVTVRARDTSNTDLTGTTVIPVNAAAVNHLTLTTPISTSTGTAFQAMLSAQDQYNNIVKSFADTIHLNSTSAQSVLPADFVLTGGAKQISIKLNTPGTQTITATDTTTPSLHITSGNINVGAAIAKLVVTAPTTATAGAPSLFTVTAQDNAGNTVPGYNGTVHITSTDATATLPSDITLVNGVGSFNVTLKKATTSTVTATDTVTPSLKGTGTTVVNAAAASKITITAPANITAGTAFYAQVTAIDAYGNIAKGYTGTVRFTSTDPSAVLPANTTLPNGTRQVTIKLKTIGSQTFTTTDTGNASITGTSPAVAVH